MKEQKLPLIDKLVFVVVTFLLGGVIFFLTTYARDNGVIKPLSLSASDAAAIASRDMTRISDLTQLQSDLELYHNKCGYYPGAPQATSPCGPFVVQGNYARLSISLMGSNLGIASVPNDPKTGVDYIYGTNAGSEYESATHLVV